MLLFHALLLWQGGPVSHAGPPVASFFDPTEPLPDASGPAIPVTVSVNGVTTPYIVRN